MKRECKKIKVLVLLSILAFPSYAAMEPNRPAAPKVQPSIDSPQPRTTQNLVSQESRSPGQIEAELGKEYYRDCVQTLKWALGIIVAFVAYVVFKSGREHKEALADVKQTLGDAREACKEARAASDKAREYEEKARERLNSVDEVVGGKLKEIEEKGKTLITSLIQEAEKQREASREEAEKQRKISELWNEGLRAARAEDFEIAAKCFSQIVRDFNFENALAYAAWAAALVDLAKRKEGAESESLLRAALEKCEKAVQIKPDFYQAYSNWGAALNELASLKEGVESESLLSASLEKCQKAIQIKPDFYNAHGNWGAALLDLGKRKEGAESEALLNASLEKCQKAVQIKPDYHEAYSNWANVLIELAKRKDGEDRRTLLDEAKRRCLQAESIKEGSGAYNLACVCALLGDEAGSRKWLETAHRCGILPTRGYVISDADLESVRDKEWFKQIKWPQKGKLKS